MEKQPFSFQAAHLTRLKLQPTESQEEPQRGQEQEEAAGGAQTSMLPHTHASINGGGRSAQIVYFSKSSNPAV